MTHAISVPTPFTEISELAESFAPRVDDERLMLPHYEPVPEGDWVQFAVTFADGSGALVGTGRCSGCYDNGEDRAPEHRFDVVIDGLELDEMGQIYFERILMVRAAQTGGEPITGEVQIPEEYPDAAAYAVPAAAAVEEAGDAVRFDDLPDASQDAQAYPPADDGYAHAETYDAQPPAYEPPAYEPPVYQPPAYEPPVYEPPAYEPPAEAFAEPAYEAPQALAYDPPSGASDWNAAPSPEDAPQDEPSAPSPQAARPAQGERLAPPLYAIYELPAPVAPGRLPTPHANGAALKRRAVAASWAPEPALRPDPSPSSGLFLYGDHGLPQPAQPPRPQIDVSQRVLRAPRSGDPLAVEIMRASGSAAVAYASEAYSEADAYAQPVQANEVYGDPGEGSPQEGGEYVDEHAEDEYDAVPEGSYSTMDDETAQVDVPDEDERY